MTDLWIATGNPKKHRELDRLLQPLGYTLHLQTEAEAEAENLPRVVEDQPDFAGNARIKATTLARAVQALAVGDDSGLCVDALGGRPGVHSARYAGDDATDSDRVQKLLAELAGLPPAKRGARFVCSICLAGPDGRALGTFEGICEGCILESPRGAGGFGYDPIFVAREHLMLAQPPSFAELSPGQKDAVSHRGRALALLVSYLGEHPDH